jgi:hypothetical protein
VIVVRKRAIHRAVDRRDCDPFRPRVLRRVAGAGARAGAVEQPANGTPPRVSDATAPLTRLRRRSQTSLNAGLCDGLLGVSSSCTGKRSGLGSHEHKAPV